MLAVGGEAVDALFGLGGGVFLLHVFTRWCLSSSYLGESGGGSLEVTQRATFLSPPPHWGGLDVKCDFLVRFNCVQPGRGEEGVA